MKNLSRHYLLFLFYFFIFTFSYAQTFDSNFDGTTIRLDYVFAGDASHQNIYLVRKMKAGAWAGRRGRLAQAPLRGNGQITMLNMGTDEVLYVHTFSTLFQEWQATDEAQHQQRAFESTYLLPMPRTAVDIRVTLTDYHDNITASHTFTLFPTDILLRQLPETPSTAYRALLRNGDPSDHVDIAILAEGYTEDQMPKFYADAQRAVDAIFTHEPFASMKKKFNVIAVGTPSADEGPSIPHLNLWRQTACHSHYDTFYTDRYLMTDHIHAIYDHIGTLPAEHIIIMVNSATYGGGGIYNQITLSTSDHPTFRQVLVHEFGHAYGGLGDEYDYGDEMANMYNSTTEPWEPNLTTLVDFKSKWQDMLPQGTTIPTPRADIPDFRKARTAAEWAEINAATQRVGVFEGGGYQSHGVYRPAQECRMKINEVEQFCPVCDRALRRITDFYTSQF